MRRPLWKNVQIIDACPYDEIREHFELLAEAFANEVEERQKTDKPFHVRYKNGTTIAYTVPPPRVLNFRSKRSQ